MRTAAVMIVVTLAATLAAWAADQSIDAKVSGKIEGPGDGKVSGTVTIKLAPATHEKAAERDKIKQVEECGKAWNKKLADYDKARRDGLKPGWLWLTRLDYRRCTDKCLAGNVATPLECKADLEKPAQQTPAGHGGG
jgi:hypothetical protein